MIKINLATKKQPAFASSGEKSGATTFGEFSKIRITRDTWKELPLRSLGILALFAVAGSYFVSDYKESEVKKVEATIQKLEQRKSELNTLSKKSAGFQDLKKTLESDEFTMRTKIDAIQKLLVNRKSASELLVTLSDVIPEDVWLGQVTMKDLAVAIKGNSTDFDLVSDFMKRMGESPVFADLVLRSTQKSLDSAGIEIASFELTAKRRP